MRYVAAFLFALAACGSSSNAFHGADDAVDEGEGEDDREDDGEGESESESEGEDQELFTPELGCTPPEFDRADTDRFREVSDAVGLGQTGEESGVCMLDYDLDGDPDLFLTGSGLFRNDGGVFTDMSGANLAGGRSCFAFDADNDGDPDLLHLWPGGMRLSRNDSGSFTDVTATAGFSEVGGLNESAAACDIEPDGDLDVVVVGYQDMRVRLFVNENGTFTEEGEDRGIAVSVDPKHSVLCADVTGDGSSDILLAGESGGATRLYWNEGDGSFSDGDTEFGFVGAGASHGIALADYDLDGHADAVVGAIQVRSFFFDGDPEELPIFREVSDAVGLGAPMIQKHPARGVGLYDFDQDGLVDLFVSRRGEAELYWNEGGVFSQETDGVAALGASPYARGTAFGDIDGDGDIDVVVANSTAPAAAPNGKFDGGITVYRNEIATGHWLRVRLVGTVSNRQGAGAVVTVAVDGGCSYTKEQIIGGSFLSTDEPVLYFGFGAATTADVTVEWPNGATSTVADVMTNQTITITE